MSKVTDLSMNLVPTRLPKKNIVETTKAEEIASKIHASIVAEPSAVVTETEAKKESLTETKVEETPKTVAKTKKETKTVAKTPPSVKKRVARTIIEDPDAVRKTSFDFPVTLYRAMKIRLAEDGISMRDYVISLIEDDLNSR